MMSIDIIGLIEAFNLYVLPPILIVVVVGTLAHRRRASDDGVPPDDDASLRLDRLDRERTVRLIGLLNLGLALRAFVMAIPEFQAYYISGNFSIFAMINIGMPLVVAALNLPIGLGLWWLRPWARWAEVVWNLLLSALALPLFVWLWRLGASITLAEWPDIAVSKVLPPLLVLLMLSPATARVVSAEHRALVARTPHLSTSRTRRSLTSSLIVGFLVIVGSVVVVNSLDWAIRIRPELNGSSPFAP